MCTSRPPSLSRPQELLLPILQAAAPDVILLLDPPLPDGLAPEELPPGAASLFRLGEAPLPLLAEPLQLLISLLVLGHEEEEGQGAEQQQEEVVPLQQQQQQQQQQQPPLDQGPQQEQ